MVKVKHTSLMVCSFCIPPPTLAKRPFPNKSSPNTSPCTPQDTSPCQERFSCAGGTLSAHAVPRHKHIQSWRNRRVTVSAGKGLSQSKPPSLACAARTFVLMDQSKVGAPGLLWFGTLRGVEAVVMDADPDGLVSEDAAEQGCRVLY